MTNILSNEFDGTAFWREGCARRFPHDSRNQAAVDELRKLQKSPCIDAAVEAKFQEMIDGDDPCLSGYSESLNERLSAIGFHSSPSAPDEVMIGNMDDLKYGAAIDAA